jgi:hypothetical protein
MRSLIGRFAYHCGWAHEAQWLARTWKPGTGEIPLLSLWSGAIEAHVMLTSARIGSLGPRRYPYSYYGWVPLRPSDFDFRENWKPGTGEIPLLSLWLGAIETQWFWLQGELEAWDRGDSPTLTVVGCHWGPVILTKARIGSLGPGRFPYSHCGWVPLRPSDADFSQNWKPGTGEIPQLSLWLGAIEAQWFRLRPELEVWDRGDSPTHTFEKRNWILPEFPINACQVIQRWKRSWLACIINQYPNHCRECRKSVRITAIRPDYDIIVCDLIEWLAKMTGWFKRDMYFLKMVPLGAPAG